MDISSQQKSTDVTSLPTRPLISVETTDALSLRKVCPSNAIGVNPVRIDLGRCSFCGACAKEFPDKISFTSDEHIATNVRDRLIVLEGDSQPIEIDPLRVRQQLKLYQGAIRCFEIGALIQSDNEVSNDHQAVASTDITFTTFPVEANGLIVTCAVDADNVDVIRHCYDVLQSPKLMILAGPDAINSEMMITRSGGRNIPVDLYVPGLQMQSVLDAIIQLTKTKTQTH